MRPRPVLFCLVALPEALPIEKGRLSVGFVNHRQRRTQYVQTVFRTLIG